MKTPMLIKNQVIYPRVQTTTRRNGIKDDESKQQEHRYNLLYNNKLPLKNTIVSNFSFKNINNITLRREDQVKSEKFSYVSSNLKYCPKIELSLNSVPITGIDRLTPI